ncbi:MAG: dTDP-4-dehydrorhamnose 3,5-epimerase [Crocinitomicaceae bacterium]|jgi:dTDP-4-dehydrorhamnose 3,5-epimerase|nr:dTDP-4-dehydrorhamnose 3,5-epimerase [Crocinitomicaceae bacterium]
MEFERCSIPDVVLCKPSVFGDHRGYFFESFRMDKFNEFIGRKIEFCQDNESKSQRGVIRGMHFQKMPYTQSKLVRVVSGAVLDVAVDMRKDSPYFGQVVVAELTEENKHQLFVPRGFAHGFVVLSEEAVFSYKCDNYYAPSHDSGFFALDQDLQIDWKIPAKKLLFSEKDKNLPTFKNAAVFENSEELYKN